MSSTETQKSLIFVQHAVLKSEKVKIEVFNLLGQKIKDNLCGTKVLWKTDYQLIQKNRDYFGDFDPFGDFDLLFGSAKLNLKIVDIILCYF